MSGHPKAPNRQLNRVPRWLRYAIQRAIREGKLPSPEDANGTGGELLRWLWQATPYRYVFDHWGTELTPAGVRALVSEPYRLGDAELIGEVEGLADLLGCRFTISSDSQWSPGSTIKIVLFPAEGVCRKS